MNTEDSQQDEQQVESVVLTTGERLRQGREQLGLTQQVVAQRLCLKVSTIRDIESDKVPEDLASTFLRGYIRSYAKLVHLSEEELLALLAKQAPLKEVKVSPIQSFSLGKKRKKREGWLMTVTWLVFLVVIGITGFWWWQNHQAQRQDIVDMADESSTQLTQKKEPSLAASDIAEAPPIAAEPVEPARIMQEEEASKMDAPTVQEGATMPSVTVPPMSSSEPASQSEVSPVLPSSQMSTSLPSEGNSVASTGPEHALPTADLMMTFNADCWLEVKDAMGKTLFSGIKKAGDNLRLVGVKPYQLTIGVPTAVEIEYQGKSVDLSEFIKSSRVARLEVGTG